MYHFRVEDIQIYKKQISNYNLLDFILPLFLPKQNTIRFL